MRIIPKTEKEALKLVYDVLNQGDSRYNSPEEEMVLSKFLIIDSIELEERLIQSINKPDENEINLGVQWEKKYIAKTLLIKEGFKDNEIFFERLFLGSRPDVLVESNHKIVAVECCSCRIDKVISYLNEVDEVWIITRGEPPYEKIHYLKDKMQWFVFKKGKNWSKVLDFQKARQEELKKIPSPLDSLMEKENSTEQETSA